MVDNVVADVPNQKCVYYTTVSLWLDLSPSCQSSFLHHIISRQTYNVCDNCRVTSYSPGHPSILHVDLEALGRTVNRTVLGLGLGLGLGLWLR